MKLNELLLSCLNSEVERSRRALAEVPAGQYEWKPHERSMKLGYLSDMVATIPTWLVMQVTEDQLDVAPEGASKMKQEPKETSEALIKALDDSANTARAALQNTSEEHLLTPWKLLAHGQVVMEAPRYQMIQDTISHWSHHRGQLTVYLRLLGAKVPAIFGPSADEQRF